MECYIFVEKQNLGVCMEAEIFQKELYSYGLLMLCNCSPDSLSNPVTWKGEAESDYNKTTYGLGDTMIKCGISPDTILDTYFHGPKEHRRGLSYEQGYAYLEASRFPELVKIGIPKKEIIKNIRKKNEDRESAAWRHVIINEEAIENMRRAGCSNAEIMDAMAIQHYHDEDGRNYYKKIYGFSDDDFIELSLRRGHLSYKDFELLKKLK